MSEDFTSFAMWDGDRWLASDTYNALTGRERRLLAPFFLWQSQKGPILDDPFLLYQIAWADEHEAGQRFLKLIRETLAKAFVLEGREWINKTAIGRWSRHHEASLRRVGSARVAGLASAAKRREEHGSSSSSSTVVERDVQRPSTSTSTSPSLEKKPSKVTKRRTVGQQTSLVIVESDPVLDDAVSRYLAARAMRRNPGRVVEAQTFGAVARGTFAEVRKKMADRVAEGHPYPLLISMPALVPVNNDEWLHNLTDNAVTLLRDGATPNPQTGFGATNWPVKIDGMLDGLIVSKWQAEILRQVGTYDYIASRGIKKAAGK